MGSEGTNHLTTLFLISNSFNGFGFGLVLFAFGVGSSVAAEVTDVFVICITIGLAIIGVSLTGTCGAIAQNRKIISIYITLMANLTAGEIVQLVMMSKSSIGRPDDVLLRAYFIAMIFIIVISIVSVLLAFIMYYRICHASAMAEIAEKRRQAANP